MIEVGEEGDRRGEGSHEDRPLLLRLRMAIRHGDVYPFCESEHSSLIEGVELDEGFSLECSKGSETLSESLLHFEASSTSDDQILELIKDVVTIVVEFFQMFEGKDKTSEFDAALETLFFGIRLLCDLKRVSKRRRRSPVRAASESAAVE